MYMNRNPWDGIPREKKKKKKIAMALSSSANRNPFKVKGTQICIPKVAVDSQIF